MNNKVDFVLNVNKTGLKKFVIKNKNILKKLNKNKNDLYYLDINNV